MGTYYSEARNEAWNAVEYYLDEIVDHLLDYDEAPYHPLNDIRGFDEYHHTSHVDSSYSLMEAAEILDDLSNYEETDNGLWDGIKDPREAVSAQAAYTYGNAVLSMFCDYMKEIDDDDDIRALREQYGELLNADDGSTDFDQAAHDAKIEALKAEIKTKIKELA